MARRLRSMFDDELDSTIDSLAEDLSSVSPLAQALDDATAAHMPATVAERQLAEYRAWREQRDAEARR
ncbi:hypothetical protein [Streptomyces sp. NPDC052042]|uniref:hypothetical protein n=1 Tax=Streptomyces sp. NPDC052042 TaxID=3365683 RepID=UPI0037D91646